MPQKLKYLSVSSAEKEKDEGAKADQIERRIRYQAELVRAKQSEQLKKHHAETSRAGQLEWLREYETLGRITGGKSSSKRPFGENWTQRKKSADPEGAKIIERARKRHSNAMRSERRRRQRRRYQMNGR